MEAYEKEFLIGLLDECYSKWSCINALGVKPFKDGNQWSFLYGDNLQEGIAGFGGTIYEAANAAIEKALTLI